MAEERKDRPEAARTKDETDSKSEAGKAWEKKVKDTSGRDWSKPKSFKPEGTV
jgi:hypothetical protein